MLFCLFNISHSVWSLRVLAPPGEFQAPSLHVTSQLRLAIVKTQWSCDLNTLSLSQSCDVGPCDLRWRRLVTWTCAAVSQVSTGTSRWRNSERTLLPPRRGARWRGRRGRGHRSWRRPRPPRRRHLPLPVHTRLRAPPGDMHEQVLKNTLLKRIMFILLIKHMTKVLCLCKF